MMSDQHFVSESHFQQRVPLDWISRLVRCRSSSAHGPALTQPPAEMGAVMPPGIACGSHFHARRGRGTASGDHQACARCLRAPDACTRSQAGSSVHAVSTTSGPLARKAAVRWPQSHSGLRRWGCRAPDQMVCITHRGISNAGQVVVLRCLDSPTRGTVNRAACRHARRASRTEVGGE